MKKIFVLFFVLFILSCSQKAQTLRRLDQIDSASKKLKQNPDNEEIIDDIIDSAQNGNREARSESLWILANNKTPLAYGEFIDKSVQDTDFNVRTIALYGVGFIDENYDNEDIINSVNTAMFDVNTQVQIEALNAAGKLKSEAFLNNILKKLSSKNKWVRLAAIEAIKDYDDDRISKALENIVKLDRDYAVRDMARQVINYRNEGN